MTPDLLSPGLPYPEIDPVLIRLGPLPIRWYALAYLAGIIAGWRYARALGARISLWDPRATPSATSIDDMLVSAAFGIILGGRLGYVAFYHPDWFLGDLQILFGLFSDGLAGVGDRLASVRTWRIWDGGMAFHGGLIGVGVALAWQARRSAISTLALADVVAPAAPIGLFFGRVANFINGELWGRPWNGPWSMIFPADPLQVPRHPSQLYEAALEGLVLFLALSAAVWLGGALRRSGLTTGLFLVGYALARLLVEGVREPDAHMPEFPLGLTMGMMLSVPMAIVGVALIARAYREQPAVIR